MEVCGEEVLPSKYSATRLQVCELDIIFNFEKAYFMLDELLIGGEVQETSKKNVLKAIAAQDLLQEVGPTCHSDIESFFYGQIFWTSFCGPFWGKHSKK